MSMQIIYWIILFIVILGGLIGCFFIVKKEPLRYGIIFILSGLISTSLCLFFYSNGFYRFVLPIYFIIPAVILSFSFLVLFTIRYRPTKRTFPFYFITITLVFSIEIFLRDVFHYIEFRGEWDAWDSYSLYWVYLRFFNYIGDQIVADKYRNSISSSTKKYWIVFGIIVLYSIAGGAYLLLRYHSNHIFL